VVYLATKPLVELFDGLGNYAQRSNSSLSTSDSSNRRVTSYSPGARG
jgi:hypothetical protein